MKNPTYLDYAAATPLDERVLTAMQPFFADQFYNPSSPYIAARHVKASVNDARHQIAMRLGAKPAEIIFTAGATESVNLALFGVLSRFSDANIVTTATEHDAVLACVQAHRHSIIPVLATGRVDLNVLRKSIDDSTALVSIAYANNEIGTVQSLGDIAQLIKTIRADRQKRGIEQPLYLHTDASQAGNYLDIHVSRLGVDLLTLNAGKIYGPKQVGLLYVKSGITLQPLVAGGGQEQNLRSGTENVAGIIGFARALEIAQTERHTEAARLATLRDQIQNAITTALPDTQVNGSQKKRLPNNLHLSWPNVDGERLVMLLDERGVMASTGSACAANKNTGSHVLPAIGLNEQMTKGSLRLTLGRHTSEAEVKTATDIIIKSVQELRAG